MRFDNLLSFCAVVTAIVACIATPAHSEPRVVLISLDGATPRLVREFMRDGTIPSDKGLGLLARHGATADHNITVHPSLTAPAHIAIATGSTAARNDIQANTFHLAASPFITTISGFSAPIGGYSHHGPEDMGVPPVLRTLHFEGRKFVNGRSRRFQAPRGALSAQKFSANT
jgi:hypothetical protein